MPQPPQPQAQGGSCRRRLPTASPICGSATTATTSSFHPGTRSVTLSISSSCSQGFASFNSFLIWYCVHWGGVCCSFRVVVWEVDFHILDWVCRRWGYMMPAPMCSRANSRTGHLFWIAAFTMTRQGSALAQITQSAGTVPSFSSSS